LPIADGSAMTTASGRTPFAQRVKLSAEAGAANGSRYGITAPAD